MTIQIQEHRWESSFGNSAPSFNLVNFTSYQPFGLSSVKKIILSQNVGVFKQNTNIGECSMCKTVCELEVESFKSYRGSAFISFTFHPQSKKNWKRLLICEQKTASVSNK